MKLDQDFINWALKNGGKIIHIKETKRSREIDKAVNKYCMDIEEAHKRASKSTLRFKEAY